MNDLAGIVDFIRARIDENEAWALAASQAYPYATDKTLPEGGVHWRWVASKQWKTVIPDPVLNEFVVEPGYSCHLATVEEWPTDRPDRPMPRIYDSEIVEMDASAAGHIIRHDPARTLREVAAHRALLALHKIDTKPETKRTEPGLIHRGRSGDVTYEQWSNTQPAIAWVETGQLLYACECCDYFDGDLEFALPEGCETIRILASIWSNHPSWRSEWSVTP